MANITDNKRTGFYNAGIYTIIGSGVAGLCMIFRYWFTGYIYDLKIADVAQSIVSISGLLASIAGLFFVLDNLILQRKSLDKQNESLIKQTESINHQRDDIALQREDIALQRLDSAAQTNEFIKTNAHYEKQNETLILQKNDSTFFNLIDLHKNIADGLKVDEFFKDTLTETFKATLEYSEMFNEGQFQSFADTRQNPRYLCSPQNFHKRFELEIYISNVKEIIYFIHNKLGNEVFYHKILYNVLTSDERYIIGMAQTLELFNFYKAEDIEGSPFDYSVHYKSLDSYQFYKGYFPMLQIESSNRGTKTHKSSIIRIPYNIKVTLLENFLNHQLIFKDVKVYVQEKDSEQIPEVTVFTIGKELKAFEFLDYADIIKKIVNTNKKGVFEIKFVFSFQYNFARIFSILHFDILSYNNDETISFLNNHQ